MARRKLLLERVSEALMSTPPNIRGLFVGDRLHEMTGWSGDGRDRVFEIDGLLDKTHKEMLRLGSRVALNEQVRFERMHIEFKAKYVHCPACSRRLKAGGPFWSHYNSRHAIRPYWLNKEDWEAMFDEPFVPPRS